MWLASHHRRLDTASGQAPSNQTKDIDKFIHDGRMKSDTCQKCPITIRGGVAYRGGGHIRYLRGVSYLGGGQSAIRAEGVRPTEEARGGPICHRRGCGLPRRSIAANGGGAVCRGGGQYAIGGSVACRGWGGQICRRSRRG